MKNYVRSLDKLPILVKILLALPVIDGIVYGIYRIAKGNVLWGILWIIIGAVIGWLLDIISILLYKKPIWLV